MYQNNRLVMGQVKHCAINLSEKPPSVNGASSNKIHLFFIVCSRRATLLSVPCMRSHGDEDRRTVDRRTRAQSCDDER